MVRIVLAGLFGGILMFVWGAVVHAVLPFERDALRPLPEEAAVMATLGTHLPQPGMYAFPAMPGGAAATPEQDQAWRARVASGPSGLLVYRPNNGEVMSPRQFVFEFASNVLAAWLGALLLVQMSGGYLRRAFSIAAVGIAAWLSISVSQWAWYGFSTQFLVGDLVDQLGGWLFAGLAMAGMIRPRRIRSF